MVQPFYLLAIARPFDLEHSHQPSKQPAGRCLERLAASGEPISQLGQLIGSK